jgi:hypothetical protein
MAEVSERLTLRYSYEAVGCSFLSLLPVIIDYAVRRNRRNGNIRGRHQRSNSACRTGNYAPLGEGSCIAPSSSMAPTTSIKDVWRPVGTVPEIAMPRRIAHGAGARGEAAGRLTRSCDQPNTEGSLFPLGKHMLSRFASSQQFIIAPSFSLLSSWSSPHTTSFFDQTSAAPLLHHRRIVFMHTTGRLGRGSSSSGGCVTSMPRAAYLMVRPVPAGLSCFVLPGPSVTYT